MVRCLLSIPSLSRASINIITAQRRTIATASAANKKRTVKKSEDNKNKIRFLSLKRDKEKRRTRSDKEFEFHDNLKNDNHVPVMLGEVLDLFSSLHLRYFVDCTLGAAGHSAAIMKDHPEMECYVGVDCDPVAHAKARACIDELLQSHSRQLKVHTFISNFKYVKSLVAEVDANLLSSGVDAVLMDLGMSSMQVNNPERGFSVLASGPLDMRMDPQASLKAEDILNSWPEIEVGRILREYGEESNWHLLQKKILQARLRGGLHSTGDLVDLIRSTTHGTRGGRQGWIKTATRVFQALRIAVNDELGTLEKTLKDCFECLAPGGRLAVISFHSLEDRIVKQTFLKIIDTDRGDENVDGEDRGGRDSRNTEEASAKEMWIRSMTRGRNGTILTKRPITPSEVEERLNQRSRSAKLRVVEKLR